MVRIVWIMELSKSQSLTNYGILINKFHDNDSKQLFFHIKSSISFFILNIIYSNRNFHIQSERKSKFSYLI